MRRWCVFINTVLILLTLVFTGVAGANQFEIKATWGKEITRGVVYTHYRMKVDGAPVHAYILSVAMDNPYVDVKPVLANDRLDSLETLPNMAVRTRAFVLSAYFHCHLIFFCRRIKQKNLPYDKNSQECKHWLQLPHPLIFGDRNPDSFRSFILFTFRCLFHFYKLQYYGDVDIPS